MILAGLSLAITFIAMAPAQGQARITKYLRVVQRKSARAQDWSALPKNLPGPVNDGDNIRTRLRSKAALRFADDSSLEIDQFTHIVVRGGSSRDVDFVGDQGRLQANYRGPGVIRGPHGNAAVAGTQFGYAVDGKSTRITCYRGLVIVGAAMADIRAGSVGSGTATTLADAALVGETKSWEGATIRIMSGVGRNQQRVVKAFDPAAGLITLDQPLPAPIPQGAYYLLTTRPDLPVVELTGGTETIVREGQAPSPPHRALPLAFADGEEKPWFAELDEVAENSSSTVYPGSLDHERRQASDWPLQDDGALQGHRSGFVGQAFNDEELPTTGIKFAPSRGYRYPFQLPVFVSPSGRFRPGISSAPLRGLPLSRTAPGPARRSSLEASDLAKRFRSPLENLYGRSGHAGGVILNAQPYLSGGQIVDDQAWGGGVRLQAQAMNDNLYLEVGGTFAHFNSSIVSDRFDVCEASLLYIGQPVGGDFKLGRQHLFPGPVNNSRFGSLMSNTVDGFLWRSPLRPGVRLEAGFLEDASPLEGDGFKGWYGRIDGPLAIAKARVGTTMLAAQGVDRNVGYSADLALPLFPNQLDAYAEWGRDSFRQGLLTAGLYFSGLAQSARLDVWLEYQSRAGFDDRVSLRLRYAVAGRFFFMGYVLQPMHGETQGGAGVSVKWRSR